MPVIISKLFDIKMFNRNHGYDLSKVRYVCSSGGRISLDMLKNIKSEFQKANFYSMYGLTEAFRSTYLSPEQIEQRPNSIGMAIPDVEILILDEDGLECKVGSIGELVHRGGCIARGYWNDPEKTAERFRTHPKYPGEILVYSGDLVTKDVDGYITFVARKDGMLKNNGIRISPTEIEEVFEMHDDVSAAIVFGIDNINNGHDIVCVYTAKNKTPIPEYELKKYLKNNLGSHMVPRYILFQTIFPTTGNQGKIDKVTVKENALHILRKEPDFYND
jgi:acyl-CoA synthetase (AMP-forming)/AMP-acid ligase II